MGIDGALRVRGVAAESAEIVVTKLAQAGAYATKEQARGLATKGTKPEAYATKEQAGGLFHHNLCALCDPRDLCEKFLITSAPFATSAISARNS